MKTRKSGTRTDRTGSYLEGQMLIAMPGMPDKRFSRSVIYMCAHTAEGAMGIVINQKAETLKFSDLLVQLDVIPAEEAIRLPERAGAIQVLNGGPVETGRGFVLHSGDFSVPESTLSIDGDVSLTATVDILRAIARGGGPHQAVLSLGYATWGARQLESELGRNGWLTCPADPALIFDRQVETKWVRALGTLGVDPSRLSMAAGRA